MHFYDFLFFYVPQHPNAPHGAIIFGEYTQVSEILLYRYENVFAGNLQAVFKRNLSLPDPDHVRPLCVRKTMKIYCNNSNILNHIEG
jgi:hypothetical protein